MKIIISFIYMKIYIKKLNLTCENNTSSYLSDKIIFLYLFILGRRNWYRIILCIRALCHISTFGGHVQWLSVRKPKRGKRIDDDSIQPWPSKKELSTQTPLPCMWIVDCFWFGLVCFFFHLLLLLLSMYVVWQTNKPTSMCLHLLPPFIFHVFPPLATYSSHIFIVIIYRPPKI